MVRCTTRVDAVALDAVLTAGRAAEEVGRETAGFLGATEFTGAFFLAGEVPWAHKAVPASAQTTAQNDIPRMISYQCNNAGAIWQFFLAGFGWVFEIFSAILSLNLGSTILMQQPNADSECGNCQRNASLSVLPKGNSDRRTCFLDDDQVRYRT